MSRPWSPPLPVLSQRERDELCRRCGHRRGEHEGIGRLQWCRGSRRKAVFVGSSRYSNEQGQLKLRVEAA